MRKILSKKTAKNVTIIDKNNTYIEPFVEIGEGTIIYPNNYIKNGAKIGKNCTILPNNFVEQSQIGDNVVLGPSAHIRPKTVIGNNVKIGNFCEIKASFVGDNCKISHLSYIGDTFLGAGCNIGCGVITANFNGKIKQKTIIENDCFVGCNTNLIAPIKIGKNCYICAGATVDKDLPPNSFFLPERKSEIGIKKNKK